MLNCWQSQFSTFKNDPFAQFSTGQTTESNSCVSSTSSCVIITSSLKTLNNSPQKIRRAQREDKTIEHWRIAVLDGKLPKTILEKEDPTMKKQLKKLKVKRGILYRTLSSSDSDIVQDQLVIPKSYRQEVLRSLHNEVGHPGQDRTSRLVRDPFYWPGMGSDIVKWVTGCDRCIRRKSDTGRAPLVGIRTSYPLELVCIDYLTLEPSKGNIGNVLVITDHYTKFSKDIPTKNQTARTTAEALFNDFIALYGVPTSLHSDQGANFESQIIQEQCHIMGMQKSRTTPYHPQGNAVPERFNSTLLNMLGTLESDQKKDWKHYVNSLVYYYKCTPHESTKVPPYELLFGRKPRLPIDVMFQSAYEEPLGKTTEEYLQDLQERMEKAHQIVKKNCQTARDRQKKNYDRKVKHVKIEVGDKVLVKRLAFDGKHKIQDKFEEEVYTVTEQPRPEFPFFTVRAPSGSERTLHRNHLLLVNNQDDASEEHGDPVEEIVDETEPDKNASKGNEEVDVNTEYEDDSDDDECKDAVHALWCGDAHNSDVVENQDMNKTENRDIVTVVIDEDDADNSEELDQVGMYGDITESVEDSTSAETVQVSVENELEQVSRQDSTDHVNTETEVEQVSLEDQEDQIGTEDPEDNRREDSVIDRSIDESEQPRNQEDDEKGAEMTEEVLEDHEVEAEHETDTKELVEEERQTSDVKQTERPVPIPRRSARERKPPSKVYLMYQMVNLHIDNKLQALENIMKSGILRQIDSDTAHRVVTAIMDS